MPTESNIDLRPNVPVCVFIPDELDDISLPDLSTIDNNMLNVPLDDTLDDSVSCNMHKLFPFSSDSSASMTNSTVTCDTTDNDSVGNASIALLEVYEVFDDDIKYCFHRPKIIPNTCNNLHGPHHRHNPQQAIVPHSLRLRSLLLSHQKVKPTHGSHSQHCPAK